jgi:transposase
LRGHNKDFRDDAPQVVIAMAVTRDGFPVRSWVFPGNTTDVTTIAQIKKDLNAWKLHRCVVVGDRGMMSEDNCRTLRGGGGGYILCVPMRRGEAEVKWALARAGRFQKVRDNLWVKEIWHPSRDAAKAQRFVICKNPDDEKRDRKQREDLLERLQAELEALTSLKEEHRKNRVHELMANKSYKRYLTELAGGRVKINRAKVRQEEKLDGKYLSRHPTRR